MNAVGVVLLPRNGSDPMVPQGNLLTQMRQLPQNPAVASNPSDQVRVSVYQTPEFEQMRAYRDRLQRGSGRLLNLPGSTMRPDVAEAHDYVSALIEKLGGEDLRARGVHLVVGIYSGDEINAAMAGHSANNPKEEVIRRRIKVEDGKPFYELLVNAGAINKLGSEEELAFVLSHELAHLFENHVNPASNTPPSARWLSKQTDEATADKLGIERMVRAGYNPEGALNLLGRLFAGQRPDPAWVALGSLAAGCANHHSEGVRISLAQGVIEYLRRTEPAARPGGELHPIPDQVKLQVTLHMEPREPRFEEMKKQMAKLVTTHFTSPDSLPWLNQVDPSMREQESHECPDFQAFLRNKFAPSRHQMKGLLDASIDGLNSSSTRPQERVDACLRLMHFLNLLNPQPGVPLDAALTSKLTSFLQNNSQGADGWKLDKWISKLSGDTKDTSPACNFTQKVFLNPHYGAAFLPLVEREPQWAKLMDRAPEFLTMSVYDSNRCEDLSSLTSLVASIDRSDSAGPLKQHLKASLFSYLQATDLSGLATSIHGPTGALHCFRALRYVYGPSAPPETPFINQVKKLLDQAVPVFKEFREKRALQVLEGSLKVKPNTYQHFFSDVYESSALFPFSADFQGQLDDRIVAFARRNNSELDEVPTKEESFDSPLDLSSGWMGSAVSRLLDSPLVAPSDKKELALFQFRNTAANLSFPSTGEKAELASRTGTYLAQLAKPELLRLLQSSDAPPAFAQWRAMLIKQVEEQGKSFSQGFFLGKLMALDSNRKCSPLTYLGANREVSQKAAEKFNLQELQLILTSLEEAKRQASELGVKVLEVKDEGPSADAGVFLLDVLLQSRAQSPELEEWYGAAKKIIDLVPSSVEGRSDYRKNLGSFLHPQLHRLPADQLRQWLERPHVLDLLSPDAQSDLLLKLVDPKLPIAQLAAQVQNLSQNLKLEKFRDGFHSFGDKLAEAANLQPAELKMVFPEANRSVTEKDSTVLRGLSAMVTLTRCQPPQEQIKMIDYLMGREPNPPEFLIDITRDAQSVAPLGELVTRARGELGRADVATRVLVANSFLAGPSAFIRDCAGMDTLRKHIFNEREA